MTKQTLDKLVLGIILVAVSFVPGSGLSWSAIAAVLVIFFAIDIVEGLQRAFLWMNEEDELPDDVIERKLNEKL